MSLLTRYFEQRDLIGALHPRDPALAELFGVRPSSSGVDVSERTSLSWSALSCGIRLLSESTASLPVDLRRRVGPREHVTLTDHPAARLMVDPNPEQTAFEFKELLMAHAVWWGNAYAQIVFNNRGIPIELWPLSPDRVTLFRDGMANLVYRVGLPREPWGISAQSMLLPADEVIHIRGFSRYGLVGDRMTQTFREAIGLGLATELFGALYFGQGTSSSGILEHPGVLSEAAQDRLRRQKENQVAGMSKAHRMMVLEEGMTWHETMIQPERAQFILTRKFQVIEAARILRVPPHMLYDLERGTFSNIEQQEIEFLTYTLLPWLVRWEQRLAKRLLGFKDATTTYFKFRINALARGDLAARMAFYTAMVQNGVLCPNDVLGLEDMNPIAGGDTHFRLSTLVPLDTPAPGLGRVPKPGVPNTPQDGGVGDV